MAVDIHSNEGKIIRQLVPLSTLELTHFKFICHMSTVENAEAGSFLFKACDTKDDLIYLISGSITLQLDGLKIDVIKAGSQSALFALAHQLPRKIDAYVNTPVRFLRIAPSLLNKQEKMNKNNDEIEDDGMMNLVKSPIFNHLPPKNLQAIFSELGEVTYKKGEHIIEQGESGRYFYFVKKGRCKVIRSPTPSSKAIKVALLDRHDTFGEDSLLSGEASHVGVKALTNITLFKLRKGDFIALIKQPLLKFIMHSQLEEKLGHNALLLDVRAPDEYEINHLAGSENVPFFLLRMQLKRLDKKKILIIICADGKWSEAAAILLLSYGFITLIIKGGMEKVTSSKIMTNEVVDTSVKQQMNNKENEVLTQSLKIQTLEIQKFKKMVQTLIVERDKAEKKYESLFKKTENLRTILDEEFKKIHP